MDRAEKKQFVENLNSALNEAAIVVVTRQYGLDAAETLDLRAKMNADAVGYKVTKNSLTKFALKGTPYEQLEEFFTGPTAIAYSADPVAAARVSANFANDNEKLEIVAGAMGEKALDAASIKQLAKLPSLDELRAKIIGLLKAPASKLVGVVQAPPGQLARVIGAYGNSGDSTS